MRQTILLVALAFIGCGDAPATDPPEPAGGDQPTPFATTELADGVYQFRYGGHNTLFVNTPAGVVAFDPISLEAVPSYAEAIRRHAPDASLHAVVYSHRDADHATGARALQAELGTDSPIIAHENARDPLVQAADPDLPPPDSTFAERTSLADGAVELVYLGRSHSDDMLVALVPAASLAFAVDFVSADRLGYRDLSSFHFPDQIHAIERLLELPFERIAFGHGPGGDRETIQRQATYYRDLQSAVAAAIDEGLTEDETAERVRMEAYADWGRYEEWRELNVRGMYRALQGTTGS